MLDFKELKKDGNDLELLVREILLTKGYRVHWSGKGPDGGKDLICFEERNSDFFNDKKIWLIQCKHKAHSGASIGVDDLDDIVDSCNQHEAQGYLLICSTFPSSGVVNRLEGITNNQKNNIDATYWDASKIEQALLTPRLWKIAQAFFPISSKQYGLNVYATENPNHWIANFKGYHFHLTNRIGSVVNYHFSSIAARIKEIENIKLPEKHFIRIRAVYFDDKNGCYTWFLDYMHPHDEEPVTSSDRIAYILGDGYALSDGQIYSFDVMTRSYLEYSDHYDKDHYDYYNPYLHNYQIGKSRDPREQNLQLYFKSWAEFEDEKKALKETSFNKLVESIKKIPFIRLIRSVNSTIEDLDKFTNLRDWSEIIEKLEIEEDRFFSAWFFFETTDEKELLRLAAFFPQEFKYSFRLTQPFIFTPKDDGSSGSQYLEEKENIPYELTLKVNAFDVTNSYFGRKLLNEFFDKVSAGIESYLNRK